jgi:uridine kinase
MNFGDPLDQLSFDIQRSAVQSRSPFVVAIDGRSGVGKSTLAALLATRLDALVISGDDFFSGGVTLRHDPPSVLAENCIDWRSLKEVVTTLSTKGQARFLPFDWEAFDGSKRSDPVVLEARPIIIVEGVYSARPELQELLDFSVLIDIPDDLRRRRLTEREGEIGAWERQWHLAEDWYFENRVRGEGFDVVITSDNSGSMTMIR